MAQQSLSRLYTLSLFVTGVLKCRVQIVEIIHESAVTIQALHSDVILHVPDGVFGIILGNIETDHWKLRNLVDVEDCIIAPICEYVIWYRSTKKTSKLHAIFKIQIPHILENIPDIRDNIVVKRQSGSLPPTPVKMVSSEVEPQYLPEAFFNCDERWINIFTNHFTKFVSVVKGLKCCTKSAQMMVFSKLLPTIDMPIADINLLFASRHYENADYKKV